MKKLMILTTVLLSATSLLPNLAAASLADSAGTWKADGAVFSLDGKKLGDYAVELVSTAPSTTELDSEITVTIPGGKTLHLSQVLKQTAGGFSLKSDQGDGGGYCLGEGICLSYAADATGHAFATTIIHDGDNQMRMVRTELQDGKAVRMYREKYVREN